MKKVMRVLCIVLLIFLAVVTAMAEEELHTHTFGEWTTITEPTCTEKGQKGRVCTVCNEEQFEAIEAKGHTEKIIDGKAATCTETGLSDGVVCSVCGTVLFEQQMIDKLNHTEEVIPGKAATCTEAGLTDGKKCSVCGTMLAEQKEIPAKGHTEETIPGKAATCTEAGLTDGKKCSVCGTVLAEQEDIPAKGHSFSEWVTRREPTCTENGEKGRVCTVCGLTQKEAILTQGHSFSKWVTRKEPTCTENGEKGRVCTVCGKTEKEAIPAQGHWYISYRVEPTTSSAGYTQHICVVCGSSYIDEWQEPLKPARKQSTTKKTQRPAATKQAPTQPKGKYGNIVTDAENEIERYEANTEMLFVQGDLLVIEATPDADGKYRLRNLNLSAELIAQLKNEGISHICFVVGDARLEFSLDAFTTDDIVMIAADLSQEPVNYVITVNPDAVSQNGENGYFVKAALTTRGNEKVDITVFVQDMVLSVGDETVTVEESGVLVFQ